MTYARIAWLNHDQIAKKCETFNLNFGHCKRQRKRKEYNSKKVFFNNFCINNSCEWEMKCVGQNSGDVTLTTGVSTTDTQGIHRHMQCIVVQKPKRLCMSSFLIHLPSTNTE